MAIVDTTLIMEYKEPFPPKVSFIEEFIKSKGIDPVRYSISSIKGNKIILDISGILKQNIKI